MNVDDGMYSDVHLSKKNYIRYTLPQIAIVHAGKLVGIEEN